jgi:hypothetical protein
MDHRPSTPGSHIDWAGDEDDSLPDLDDWGVPSSSVAPTNPDPGKTANIEKAQLQLMSPILDDSLKQLPHSFDKTSPSPSVGSGSLSPNIANVVPVLLVNGSADAGGAGVAKASSSVGVDNLEERSLRLPEPSSRMGPASPASNSQPLDSSHPPEQAGVLPSKDTPPQSFRRPHLLSHRPSSSAEAWQILYMLPTATRTRLRPHLRRHPPQNHQPTLAQSVSLRLHLNLVRLRPILPKERSARHLRHAILHMAVRIRWGARHSFPPVPSAASLVRLRRQVKGRTKGMDVHSLLPWLTAGSTADR